MFSISVTKKTKAEVIADLNAQLDVVTAAKPEHELDKTKVITVAESYLELIGDPDEFQSVSLLAAGSLVFNGPDQVNGASINISVNLIDDSVAQEEF